MGGLLKGSERKLRRQEPGRMDLVSGQSKQALASCRPLRLGRSQQMVVRVQLIGDQLSTEKTRLNYCLS